MSMKNYKRRSQLKHIKNQTQNLITKLKCRTPLTQTPEVEINPKPALPREV